MKKAEYHEKMKCGMRDDRYYNRKYLQLNMLMYSVFSVVIRNYVGIVSNLVVAATTAISLIQENKDSVDA